MKYPWLICLCALVCTGLLAPVAQATDDFRLWNHNHNKKHKCV